MILLLIAALLFVVAGFWTVITPHRFVSARFSESMVLVAGIAALLFFGLCAIFITRKVFSKKMGLVINDMGIIDNSGGTSVGLIEWADITGMSKLEIASSKILMIHTSDAEKYINRARNIIAKKAMTANHKLYGSPLSITSNALKIKFSELEHLIAEQIEKRVK